MFVVAVIVVFAVQNLGKNGGGNPTCKHEFSEWSVIMEPSCELEGSKTRICSLCGKLETQAIDSIDHNFNTNNICSICNFELEYTKGLEFGEITVGEETYYAVIGLGAAKDTDIVIPASHAGNTVTAIAPNAFHGNDMITSLYVPRGVKYVGKSAFNYCTDLKSIKLSDIVEFIGDMAFANCTKLSNIKLGDSIETIVTTAFKDTTYINNEKIGRMMFFTLEYIFCAQKKIWLQPNTQLRT